MTLCRLNVQVVCLSRRWYTHQPCTHECRTKQLWTPVEFWSGCTGIQVSNFTCPHDICRWWPTLEACLDDGSYILGWRHVFLQVQMGGSMDTIGSFFILPRTMVGTPVSFTGLSASTVQVRHAKCGGIGMSQTGLEEHFFISVNCVFF